ncbi:MAG: glycosyltransferase [Gammaproteobacteria bacterium]
MSPPPLISVLMPCRDGGDHLQAAVDSILAQSFADFELLIVDDRTRDGSLERLDCRDNRVRILRNPGEGIVDALNAGAAAARGALLARMDADDFALPDRFERQLQHLQRHPRLGVVGAQVEIFRDGGPLQEGYRIYQRWINGLTAPEAIAREIFIESPIPHPTAMIRREVFDRLGGYRDSEWSEDYDLWLRAHAAGVAMGKPEGVLLRWRDHDGRLSRSGGRYTIDRFLQAKACYLARTVLSERPAVIWGAGETGKRLHDWLRRYGVEVSGFIDIDPRKIGGRKRGLPVVSPEARKRLAGVIVVAVGSRGARPRIRQVLRQQGLSEGEEYLFAA